MSDREEFKNFLFEKLSMKAQEKVAPFFARDNEDTEQRKLQMYLASMETSEQMQEKFQRKDKVYPVQNTAKQVISRP